MFQKIINNKIILYFFIVLLIWIIGFVVPFFLNYKEVSGLSINLSSV